MSGDPRETAGQRALHDTDRGGRPPFTLFRSAKP